MGWILGTLANHNKLRSLPNFRSKARNDETEPYHLGLLIYPGEFNWGALGLGVEGGVCHEYFG